MNLFRRPRPQAVEREPLLTRPRVAEFIGRDPAQVTRYFQSGAMPDPDELLADGAPAWRQSTIRSWWLSRGGEWEGLTSRYHQQWVDQGLMPGLLEEHLVELDPRSFGDPTPILVHVRVYRAMDGNGPVVVLGLPETSRWDLPNWQSALYRIGQEATFDANLARPLWLHIHAEYRDFGSDNAYWGFLPERITVTDLRAPNSTVTLADVARIVGMSIDIYPQQVYNRRAIAQRRSSGSQDSASATDFTVDDDGLGRRVQELQTLLSAAQRDPGDVRAETLRFAAGVIADDAEAINKQVLKNADFRRGYATRERKEQPSFPPPAHVSVVRRDRDLNPAETRLVHDHRLDQPVIVSQEVATPEESDEDGGLYTVIARPDTRDRLKDLRAVLLDPDLPEHSALRSALGSTEKIVAAAARSADPEFARRDKPPVTHEWAADTQQMAAYLEQLSPVLDERDLPLEYQRRARLLRGYTYADDWRDPQVLFDPTHGLLALVGKRPSRLDEFTARARVKEDHAGSSWMAGSTGVPQLSQQMLDNLTRAYMADRALVYLEWPVAPLDIDPAALVGAHMVAPPAAAGVERPVFIKHPEGRLQPLPLRETQYRGFVWGVSGTDSLTPAVHRLLTVVPQRDWKTYPDENDDPGDRAVTWLRGHIGRQGAGDLDVAFDDILAAYRTIP